MYAATFGGVFALRLTASFRPTRVIVSTPVVYFLPSFLSPLVQLVSNLFGCGINVILVCPSQGPSSFIVHILRILHSCVVTPPNSLAPLSSLPSLTKPLPHVYVHDSSAYTDIPATTRPSASLHNIYLSFEPLCTMKFQPCRLRVSSAVLLVNFNAYSRGAF